MINFDITNKCKRLAIEDAKEQITINSIITKKIILFIAHFEHFANEPEVKEMVQNYNNQSNLHPKDRDGNITLILLASFAWFLHHKKIKEATLAKDEDMHWFKTYADKSGLISLLNASTIVATFLYHYESGTTPKEESEKLLKAILKRLEYHIHYYKDGTNDGPEGFKIPSEKESMMGYIKNKLCAKILNLTLEENGITYPHNRSNPYTHDIYKLETEIGTFRLIRYYGIPNWQGKVNYIQGLKCEIIKY
jgi:hypothetical protein